MNLNGQSKYKKNYLLIRVVACISVPLNGIPSCFLFRWRVQKGRLCFYFCSAEQNSEWFSLLRKGSERNSENFLFRGTAGILSEITTCSVNSADVNFCNQRAHLWVWICPTYKQFDSYRQGMKSRLLLWKWKFFFGFIANLIPYLVPTHFLNF